MKRLISIIIILTILLPIFVFAQPKPYTPLVPIPGFTANNAAPVDLGGYLGSLYKLLIGVTILLAVIVITISGVQNMTSESPFNKSEAKRRIGEAIGGIVLAAVSYLILVTINPALVRFDFLSGNNSSGSTSQPPASQFCLTFINEVGPGANEERCFSTLDSCRQFELSKSTIISGCQQQ